MDLKQFKVSSGLVFAGTPFTKAGPQHQCYWNAHGCPPWNSGAPPGREQPGGTAPKSEAASGQQRGLQQNRRELPDASPRPGVHPAPEHKQRFGAHWWSASSRSQSWKRKPRHTLSLRGWQHEVSPNCQYCQVCKIYPILGIIVVLSIVLWRRVLAATALAFILRLGSALTADSATHANMICIVLVNKGSHKLHHVTTADASDPSAASLMPKDVRTAIEKSRASQRKAGHDTSIRPASGCPATFPLPSSNSAGVSLSRVADSRCTGNLGIYEYCNNAMIRTTGSQFALTLPSGSGSLSKSLLQVSITSNLSHQDVLCGGTVGNTGEEGVISFVSLGKQYAPRSKRKGQQTSTQEIRHNYTRNHHSPTDDVTHQMQTNAFCTDMSLISFASISEHYTIMNANKRPTCVLTISVAVVFVSVGCRWPSAACA